MQVYASIDLQYKCIYIHVDTGYNTNRNSLYYAFKGLPFLILMPMAEEDFLWLYKVSFMDKAQMGGYTDSNFTFSAQPIETEKPRDIGKISFEYFI